MTLIEYIEYYLKNNHKNENIELSREDLEEILRALKVKEKVLHMADEHSIENNCYSTGYFDACMDAVGLF